MAHFSPRAHAGTSARANRMTLRDPGAPRKENPDEPLVKILAYTLAVHMERTKWSVHFLLDRTYNTTMKNEAVLREHLLSRFMSRSDTNWVHWQRSEIKEVEGLYYLYSEHQGVDQMHRYDTADLPLCFRTSKNNF